MEIVLRSDKALDERQRSLGNLRPTTVDDERVATVLNLLNLSDGIVSTLALAAEATFKAEKGSGNTPRKSPGSIGTETLRAYISRTCTWLEVEAAQSDGSRTIRDHGCGDQHGHDQSGRKYRLGSEA
jgi:surface antigen